MPSSVGGALGSALPNASAMSKPLARASRSKASEVLVFGFGGKALLAFGKEIAEIASKELSPAVAPTPMSAPRVSRSMAACARADASDTRGSRHELASMATTATVEPKNWSLQQTENSGNERT
jgi:hypothetical protein